MALNPWPTDTSTAKWDVSIRTLARALSREVPAAALDDPDTTENEAEEAKAAFRSNPIVLRLHRLGSMVSARIEKEVPGAPGIVKDEALIRGVGYLQDAGTGAIRAKEVDVIKTEYSSNVRWWSLCGAGSILKPWMAPRGGVIG